MYKSNQPDCLEIKLIDFSKSYVFQKGERMNEFFGTDDYMAPEMLDAKKRREEGYTEKVDEWTIGIAAYLLLTGKFSRPETINVIEKTKLSKGSKDFLY